MSPRVSVIVPAYNAKHAIAETLESVLSQSFPDLELIVVDDGSTDGTKEIVSEYKRKDDRIVYVWQKNAGVAAARNRGLEVSTGKYISVIDADDLWDRNKLRKQLMAMDAAEDTIVLTGIRRFQVINGRKVWGDITMPPPTKNESYDVLTLLLLSSFQMVLFNTALMERQLAKKIGGWNVNMRTAEDWEFWIRANQCRYRNIAEPLFHYRKHSGSLTSRQNLLLVLDQHGKVIQERLKEGYISERAAQRALIVRQLEVCGFFIYQGELVKAIRVLRRSLGLMQGWKTRAVWTRGAEILRLAFRKLSTGK